jgi:hypothetical protein
MNNGGGREVEGGGHCACGSSEDIEDSVRRKEVEGAKRPKDMRSEPGMYVIQGRRSVGGAAKGCYSPQTGLIYFRERKRSRSKSLYAATIVNIESCIWPMSTSLKRLLLAKLSCCHYEHSCECNGKMTGGGRGEVRWTGQLGPSFSRGTGVDPWDLFT